MRPTILSFRFYSVRPDLPEGRQRVRPEPTALPPRGCVRQRGWHVPLPVSRRVHRRALRETLHALQPLALPQRGHLRPEGGRQLRVHLCSRYVKDPPSWSINDISVAKP